jgi:biopolymer transport protein ExbD
MERACPLEPWRRRAKRRIRDEIVCSSIQDWVLGVGGWAFSSNRSKRRTPNAERRTSNLQFAMRRYSQRQSLSTLSEINITPLLDLAFVLLIIFMITTPLLENSMSLVIPSSAERNPPINSAQIQTVSVDRSEVIKLNNQVVDVAGLNARLSEAKRANPDVAVIIRPDRELPVQKLVTLMDALQHAGITKVGIATRAEAK